MKTQEEQLAFASELERLTGENTRLHELGITPEILEQIQTNLAAMTTLRENYLK